MLPLVVLTAKRERAFGPDKRLTNSHARLVGGGEEILGLSLREPDIERASGLQHVKRRDERLTQKLHELVIVRPGIILNGQMFFRLADNGDIIGRVRQPQIGLPPPLTVSACPQVWWNRHT